jgi:hypothetical protein
MAWFIALEYDALFNPVKVIHRIPSAIGAAHQSLNADIPFSAIWLVSKFLDLRELTKIPNARKSSHYAGAIEQYRAMVRNGCVHCHGGANSSTK